MSDALAANQPAAAAASSSNVAAPSAPMIAMTEDMLNKLLGNVGRRSSKRSRSRSPSRSPPRLAAAAHASSSSNGNNHHGVPHGMDNVMALFDTVERQAAATAHKAKLDTLASNPRVHRQAAVHSWNLHIITKYGSKSAQAKAAEAAVWRMWRTEAGADSKKGAETWKAAHHALVADAIEIDGELAGIISGVNVVAKTYAPSSSYSSSRSRTYAHRRTSRSRSRSRSPRRTSSSSSSSSSRSSRSNIECHRCKQTGHIASKCKTDLKSS